MKVQNKQLMPLQAILERLEVGQMRANRGRLKLFQRVSEKVAEYSRDEVEIIKSYARLDDAGEILVEDGQVVLEDPDKTAEVNGHLQELADEEVIIEAGEYRERFRDFFAYLADVEEVFTLSELAIIDQLLEQYEKGETND